MDIGKNRLWTSGYYYYYFDQVVSVRLLLPRYCWWCRLIVDVWTHLFTSSFYRFQILLIIFISLVFLKHLYVFVPVWKF